MKTRLYVRHVLSSASGFLAAIRQNSAFERAISLGVKVHR
jgi:hypothetical protein